MEKIKTERLEIMPLSDIELKALIKNYKTIPELSDAYKEMLEGCILNPSLRLWYTAWKICQKGSNNEIGFLGFKGIENGATEIGYGINYGDENKGYATEAVKAICKWALKEDQINCVYAETDLENFASKRVLEKCGFSPTGTVGAEGPRYILRKQKRNG